MTLKILARKAFTLDFFLKWILILFKLKLSVPVRGNYSILSRRIGPINTYDVSNI